MVLFLIEFLKSSNEDSKDLESTLDYIKNIGGNKYLHSIPNVLVKKLIKILWNNLKVWKKRPPLFPRSRE